jgi:hypothetical protein
MTEALTKYSITLYQDFCNQKITVPVVYCEDYLQNQLLDLNLARLCCSLCCASYNEEAVKSAFKECEFTEIRTYYYSVPKEDSASLCVARRGDNIFIVFRGTEGEEWYSNFRTGLGDTHQGYAEAVESLMPVLREYINSNCNLLLTGHSRGGALANLLASQLIKQGRDNVFCYTFACPNVTVKGDVYSSRFSNIHNFIYEEDFIPNCPLSQWGYNRYGNSIVFKAQEINYEKLKKAFRNLTGERLLTFREYGKTISDFTDTALHLAGNPDEYYNKGYLVDEDYITLYDYFQTVCDLFNDKNSFEAGITLLATKLSEFAPITNFLITGINIPQLINQGNAQNSCAMYAHSALTYLCLLNTQKIRCR